MPWCRYPDTCWCVQGLLWIAHAAMRLWPLPYQFSDGSAASELLPYPSSTDCWLYVMDAYRTAVLHSGCTELYELAGLGASGGEGAGGKGRRGEAIERQNPFRRWNALLSYIG